MMSRGFRSMRAAIGEAAMAGQGPPYAASSIPTFVDAAS